MNRPCVACGRLIASGSRCSRCRLRNGSTRAWRKVRRLVLIRDGFRCYHCGGPATDVHHVVAVRDGCTDAPQNLQAACTAHRGEK